MWKPKWSYKACGPLCHCSVSLLSLLFSPAYLSSHSHHLYPLIHAFKFLLIIHPLCFSYIHILYNYTIWPYNHCLSSPSCNCGLPSLSLSYAHPTLCLPIPSSALSLLPSCYLPCAHLLYLPTLAPSQQPTSSPS